MKVKIEIQVYYFRIKIIINYKIILQIKINTY
jgi:hypothetical protein